MKLHFTRWLALSLFLLCGSWYVVAAHRPGTQSVTADAPGRQVTAAEFYFHHDHIIGTSLDLWVAAPDAAAADLAERTILDEIERLRHIFSTFDPQSEISRVNATRQPVAVAPEMIEVLRLYETWQDRSRGAFNGQLGGLVRLWQQAEKAQQEPDPAALSRIVDQIRLPGWQIDGGHITRLTDQPLNLNSIAKGYIIGKAGMLARQRVPSLTGLLLNLGGDMVTWGPDPAGRSGWDIGVQDPHHPEDNAPVVARVRLRDRAIATSGGYLRHYTIQGRRHSHIFEPRTGQSAAGVDSATVVAADNVTANALATTLCVLSPNEGLALVAATPGSECLLIAADGRQFRSPGFTFLEMPIGRKQGQGTVVAVQEKGQEKGQEKADKAWLSDFEVNLSVTIPNLNAARYRRPYVAIWVENADAKPVRTVTVWGNDARYFKDLPNWWKFARNDNALVKAVTRATRAPGKYSLVWDGKDDKGTLLPQGTYTIIVEVHREHGKLVRQTGKLACGPESAQLTLEANAETGATIIAYGKKKQP